jgi:hypothetical protein
MATEFDAKHGAFLAIPFAKSNITTGASNEDLALAGALTTFIAPAAGSVVGISGSCPAITAGTATLKPHKASTEYAEVGTPAPVLSSTQDTNGTYATVRPGALTFAAGDSLGISVTSTTTLDPTNTIDVDAVLFIQLNP